MRPIFFALSLALLLTSASGGVAAAGQNCSEGKSASGQCINPHLARMMRHQSILMTQPKLSYTAPLSMPDDKDVVDPPRQLIEILSIQTPGGRRFR